jgi:hypothetical protein
MRFILSLLLFCATLGLTLAACVDNNSAARRPTTPRDYRG